MFEATPLCGCRPTGKGFGVLIRGGFRQTWFALLLLGLCSCVTPAPPGEVVEVTVADIQQGTGEMGVPVRWGGTIAAVHNKPETTLLEVVSRPLNGTGRPRHNDATYGRFYAEISGFLDPEIVSQGRDISVIGTVIRLDDGQVGEAGYEYPVLSVFDYRVWKKRSEIKGNGNYPHYFLFDRYWHNWPHHRRHGVRGSVIF